MITEVQPQEEVMRYKILKISKAVMFGGLCIETEVQLKLFAQ